MARLDKAPPSSAQQESMAALTAANDRHVRILEQQRNRAREMAETARIMILRTVKMREAALRGSIVPSGGLMSWSCASEE
jgi:hypothetical protein